MLASTLTACAGLTPSSSVGINLPALPSKLISVSCQPSTLPGRALTRSEVEKLWARDRARLAKCGYTVGGLIAFYTNLSSRLRAADV